MDGRLPLLCSSWGHGSHLDVPYTFLIYCAQALQLRGFGVGSTELGSVGSAPITPAEDKLAQWAAVGSCDWVSTAAGDELGTALPIAVR